MGKFKWKYFVRLHEERTVVILIAMTQRAEELFKTFSNAEPFVQYSNYVKYQFKSDTVADNQWISLSRRFRSKADALDCFNQIKARGIY